MPDREKVAEALECYRMNLEVTHCEKKDCPYNNNDELYGYWCCTNSILYDAVALLKEQEPIPCGEKIKAGDVVLDFYKCGYCKNAIRKPWKYCPFCGKAVKWDD